MTDYIAISDDVRALPEFPCEHCIMQGEGCTKTGPYCFDIPFINSTILHYCFPSNLPAYCSGAFYAQCDDCVEAGCSIKTTYALIGVHPINTGVGGNVYVASGTGNVYISASNTLISSPW
jgi:hypothetical protein